MKLWCLDRWGWPPDVVDRQSIRDIQLLMSARNQ